MTDYDNNMRGVLFKNDKRQSDNHPNYRGSCEINNDEYWVSAWIKQGKSGPFMSLSFTAKEQPAKAAPMNAQVSQDIDEDIPF